MGSTLAHRNVKLLIRLECEIFNTEYRRLDQRSFTPFPLYIFPSLNNVIVEDVERVDLNKLSIVAEDNI